MNATATLDPADTVTIVICVTFPILLLLCVCCIIVLVSDRRPRLVRAVVVVPVGVEAEWVHNKVVPPLPF